MIGCVKKCSYNTCLLIRKSFVLLLGNIFENDLECQRKDESRGSNCNMSNIGQKTSNSNSW